jgi:hypothetical protein
MKKEKGFLVLFFCLALICLVMSGCSQPSGSSDSGSGSSDSGSTAETPAVPTAGTLVVNNASTYADDTIISIKIHEGNSMDGAVKASSTDPVPKGGKKEFSGLTAGAYYVHVKDNREPAWEGGKTFGVTAGQTTNVNYTGTVLQ